MSLRRSSWEPFHLRWHGRYSMRGRWGLCSVGGCAGGCRSVLQKPESGDASSLRAESQTILTRGNGRLFEGRSNKGCKTLNAPVRRLPRATSDSGSTVYQVTARGDILVRRMERFASDYPPVPTDLTVIRSRFVANRRLCLRNESVWGEQWANQ